ncbi:hypothetical protein QE152_g5898 [Popillia japonica]|uniref:Uncharacterized protein n=1 Tax=Popillia japonica TaxID=7064 RepID=A0AAW1MG26_POPJA
MPASWLLRVRNFVPQRVAQTIARSSEPNSFLRLGKTAVGSRLHCWICLDSHRFLKVEDVAFNTTSIALYVKFWRPTWGSPKILNELLSLGVRFDFKNEKTLAYRVRSSQQLGVVLIT